MADTPARDATTGWAEASRWRGGVGGAGDCAQTRGRERQRPGARRVAAHPGGAASRAMLSLVTCNLQVTSDLAYARRCMPSRAQPSRAAVAPRRSRCPVSCTLDVLGDRWTLLVVRDLMRGKRRFAEFVDTPEGIPTNILSDRLKRLVRGGRGRVAPLQRPSAAGRVRADRERRGSPTGHAGDGRLGRAPRRRPHAAFVGRSVVGRSGRS